MTPVARFAFERLTRSDLPLLQGWLSAPHVAQWWGAPPDAEAVERQYGPSIDGTEPCRCYIAHVDGAAIGLIQAYRWSDWPREAAVMGAEADEAGIDYLIGDPAMIGRGVGQRMLEAFIAEVVLSDPEIRGIRTNVAVDNPRSWRCLEKLGFTREPGTRMVDGEPGPQYVLSYRSSSAR